MAASKTVAEDKERWVTMCKIVVPLKVVRQWQPKFQACACSQILSI